MKKRAVRAAAAPASVIAEPKAIREGGIAEAPSAVAPPRLVVFSADPQIAEIVRQVAPTPWKVEVKAEPGGGREALSRPNVRLVVVDDAAVEQEARGWLLDRIRRFVPHALLIYVASSHSPESERRARGHAVQYYTAKPIDSERVSRVLESFVRLAGNAESQVHLPQR